MEHVMFQYNSGERKALPAHQAAHLERAGHGKALDAKATPAQRGPRKSPRNKMTAPDVEK